MPLWVLLAWWWLRRRSRNGLHRLNYSRARQLLDALYYNLPLPEGAVETWLATRILTWINNERDALLILERLNVIATGQAERN